MQIGQGAGHLQVEPHFAETFSLNLQASHGGEYRIVGVTADQLARVAIALVGIAEVRDCLAAVRALLPG